MVLGCRGGDLGRLAAGVKSASFSMGGLLVAGGGW